jgi:hypothetical protein
MVVLLRDKIFHVQANPVWPSCRICCNIILIQLMKRPPNLRLCFSVTFALIWGGVASRSAADENPQVPTWSKEDLQFFLHGSMSTEVVPEPVLRAFIKAYPDLFPKDDFSQLGAIPDREFGWPVGFSRRQVPHLGGLSAVGINCASCHVGEITPPTGGPNFRLLGGTSQFDVETFFGVVITSTFRTAEPANMKKFLAAYLEVSDPQGGADAQRMFESRWQEQESNVITVMTGKSAEEVPGLRALAGKDLRLDAKSLASGVDLPALAASMLNLFHNMRFAVHLPDTPPPASPPSGPGRNDPWRILSYSLLGLTIESAPLKFGVIWKEDQRAWVHNDGNSHSSLVRNLAASLGLGAPMVGHQGLLNFADVQRHTSLSDEIRPPRYPWSVNPQAVTRGGTIYRVNCVSCHDGPATDARLYTVAEIKTDPNRARIFTPSVAEGFNKFNADLRISGYEPPKTPAWRSTQKYWAPSLDGVWARAPYLHNGSVRTMQELLTPPADRAKTYHRGSRVYDTAAMGYTDEGAYVLDTAGAGNANTGHDYGTNLAEAEKRDLIEFLKTR